MTQSTDQVRFPCLVLQQKGVTIYQFNMNAAQFEAFARVDHFGEKSDGVNRMRDDRHAERIAKAMVDDEHILMLDAVIGDLVGDWRYEHGYLVPGPNAYLSIDDGQHRNIVMTEKLSPEERAKWTLPINATQGLSVEQRLHIFRQQGDRKPIDSKLDLAMRWRLDNWRTPWEREAYSLMLQLNSDPNSPLQGLIILDETVVRTYEHRHRPEGINGAGLHQVLVSAMGSKSPLFTLAVEKRGEVIRNLIQVASEAWPDAWRSNAHVLTTSRGINAIIRLITRGPEFKASCGTDYTIGSLKRTLSYAKGFNWTQAKWKRVHPTEICENLDKAIGAGKMRSAGAVSA